MPLMKDFGPAFDPQCLPCWHKDTASSRHVVMLQFHLGPGHGKESSASQQTDQDAPSLGAPGKVPLQPLDHPAIVLVNCNRSFNLFLVSSVKKNVIDLESSCLPLGSLQFARFPAGTSASLTCMCIDLTLSWDAISGFDPAKHLGTHFSLRQVVCWAHIIWLLL